MRSGANKPESLEERLEKRIARKRGDVFLRADFDDMGGYDQVGRALRKLGAQGAADEDRLRSLHPRPAIIAHGQADADQRPPRAGGRSARASRRRDRADALEQDYNAGKTTQVPTGRVIAVRGRVRRTDRLQWCPSELRTCWTGASLKDVAGRLRPDPAWSRRIGTSCARLQCSPDSITAQRCQPSAAAHRCRRAGA